MLGNFLAGGAGGSSGGSSSHNVSAFLTNPIGVAFGTTRLYMGKTNGSYTETSVYPVLIRGLTTASSVTVKKVWVNASVAPGASCPVTLRLFNNADTAITFTFGAADTYKEWTGSTVVTAGTDSFLLAFDLVAGVWGATFEWGILYEAT